MHAPKQFALGLAILLFAAFCARNHYRRWRDRFGNAVDDYVDDWYQGNTFPVTVIGFLFILSGVMTYASFIPNDDMVIITSGWPYVQVTPKATP